MSNPRSRRHRRSGGQVLVLAALLVLALALAVLTTSNVGHAVHDRVRLQNTADAAAYSMAAAEARAFNLYAFANRAQASHYVSAMTWQSILSFVYFAEAFLVDAYGVMRSISPCGDPRGFWVPLCEALTRVPFVASTLRTLTGVLALFRGYLHALVLPSLRRLDPDRWVGRHLIPAHRTLNGVLAAVSAATLRSALGVVSATASAVIEANDPAVDPRRARIQAGAVSACLFGRAHMREANGDAWNTVDPFVPIDPTAVEDRNRASRAKRAMGAVANATRFPCDRPGQRCPAGWVTRRNLDDLVLAPAWLEPVQDLIRRGAPEWKWGQTRMLTTGLARGRPWRGDANFIRDWKDAQDSPIGMMAQGDDLGSDDLYRIALGPPRILFFKNPFSCDRDDDPAGCWGDNQWGRGDAPGRQLPFRSMLKTSIWALNEAEGIPGGLHYRLAYVRPRWPEGEGWAPPLGASSSEGLDEASIGLSRVRKCVVPWGCCPTCPKPHVEFDVWVANVRGIRDGNHPWGGVVPFSHFEPGQFAEGCGAAPDARPGDAPALRTSDFNQPSTWVVLEKQSAEPPARVGGRASVSMDQQTLVLDNRAGMTVLARGQVYYHRPGNWTEHPNFFNPYWRPRLASAWQGRRSLPGLEALVANLPAPLRSNPQRVLTH